jgi:hypothetical protein
MMLYIAFNIPWSTDGKAKVVSRWAEIAWAHCLLQLRSLQTCLRSASIDASYLSRDSKYSEL